MIDVDRDFARITVWRSITAAGRRKLLGGRHWNPSWFVAHGGAEGTWTAEAAIPLAELTGEAAGLQECWAVGVQRIVPGVGFQSWTTPATAEIMPEGFGS